MHGSIRGVTSDDSFTKQIQRDIHLLSITKTSRLCMDSVLLVDHMKIRMSPVGKFLTFW